jgi:methanogenic corrinoid protein MtbC1
MGANDLPHLPPVDPAAERRVAPTTMTPEILATLLVEGDDELAAWTLQNALAERTRAEVFDGLLREAMAMIGSRWSEGRWSIADEHLASQTVTRALDRIQPPTTPEARVGPLAVLAGVAGEHHTIGLVCLQQVLADVGWTVADLGPDLPAADLARFVVANEASLVGLTAALPERAEAVREAVLACRTAAGRERPVRILLGGALAADGSLVAELGLDFAGVSLVAASQFARRLADDLEQVPPGG